MSAEYDEPHCRARPGRVLFWWGGLQPQVRAELHVAAWDEGSCGWELRHEGGGRQCPGELPLSLSLSLSWRATSPMVLAGCLISLSKPLSVYSSLVQLYVKKISLGAGP